MLQVHAASEKARKSPQEFLTENWELWPLALSKRAVDKLLALPPTSRWTDEMQALTEVLSTPLGQKLFSFARRAMLQESVAEIMTKCVDEIKKKKGIG